MKVRRVKSNHRRKALELSVGKNTYDYPFAKLDPKPTPDNRIVKVFVDKELGGEAFTYVLESGVEGTVRLPRLTGTLGTPSR